MRTYSCPRQAPSLLPDIPRVSHHHETVHFMVLLDDTHSSTAIIVHLPQTALRNGLSRPGVIFIEGLRFLAVCSARGPVGLDDRHPGLSSSLKRRRQSFGTNAESRGSRIVPCLCALNWPLSNRDVPSVHTQYSRASSRSGSESRKAKQVSLRRFTSRRVCKPT